MTDLNLTSGFAIYFCNLGKSLNSQGISFLIYKMPVHQLQFDIEVFLKPCHSSQICVVCSSPRVHSSFLPSSLYPMILNFSTSLIQAMLFDTSMWHFIPSPWFPIQSFFVHVLAFKTLVKHHMLKDTLLLQCLSRRANFPSFMFLLHPMPFSITTQQTALVFNYLFVALLNLKLLEITGQILLIFIDLVPSLKWPLPLLLILGEISRNPTASK